MNDSEDSDLESWVVLKFGGTSVANAARWQNIASILRERLYEGLQPLVVCSAVKGATDFLERLQLKAVARINTGPLLVDLFNHHEKLCRSLGIEASPLLDRDFDHLKTQLRRLETEGRTPALQAEITAMGEVLSTRIGAAYLESQGLPAVWQDARHLLESEANGHSQRLAFLSASCLADFDPALRNRLDAYRGKVVITQGFIAGNRSGETVLLGRGGSDTSASYLAARIGASRVEIWTDVPGMFTANPHRLEQARLLRRLDYQEAELMSEMGAKVLHRRCVAPLSRVGIPLLIRCTQAPEIPGTLITRMPEPSVPAGVKAISSREKMLLVAAESANGQSGAAVLHEFTHALTSRSLEVDSISSSGRTLRATVNPSVTPVTEEVAGEILEEINSIAGNASVEREAASLSLVGTGLDTLYHQIGPALSPLSDADVHFVGTGHDGMDITFFLKMRNPFELVSSIHGNLFGEEERTTIFGDTWKTIQERFLDRKIEPEPTRESEAVPC